MIKAAEKRAAMFSVKTGAAAASCRPDPIREKGVLKSPQAFQNPKISNNSSSEAAQSNAEGILNHPFPRHCRAAAHHCAGTSFCATAQTSLRQHIIAAQRHYRPRPPPPPWLEPPPIPPKEPPPKLPPPNEPPPKEPPPREPPKDPPPKPPPVGGRGGRRLLFRGERGRSLRGPGP